MYNLTLAETFSGDLCKIHSWQANLKCVRKASGKHSYTRRNT